MPDLNELIALPQDEMRDVVVRFVGSSGGRGEAPPTALAVDVLASITSTGWRR